jgi:hypothetical protein
MKGVTNRTSCRPIFKELKILTVTSLYILEVLCYFKKHDIYTTKNSDLYEYDTRRKDDLHVQKCNTLMCRKGVINMGIKLYNNLQLELRKVKGERKFQHKLKRYLQEHPSYTLHEYLSEGQ